MKMAIIADDLTGASDTGVQWSRAGFDVSVQLNLDVSSLNRREVVVYDTDSRGMEAAEAADHVRRLCTQLAVERPEFVYKKIDSTMRGHIAAELGAICDVFQPDFAVIAPAFPDTGRLVKDGVLYVNGTPVHETDAGRDSQNPVALSDVAELLKQHTNREIHNVPLEDLYRDRDWWERQLQQWRRSNDTVWLVPDIHSEDDLRQVATRLLASDYKVIWTGSAGLARALSEQLHPAHSAHEDTTRPRADKILAVVGSTNTRARKQLDELLSQEGVVGLEWKVDQQAGSTDLSEMDLVVDKARHAYEQHDTIVLYSSPLSNDAANSDRDGCERTLAQISKQVAASLGEAASRIVHQCHVGGLIMTGGDTAKRICTRLGCNEMELYGEIESGVPIGRLLPEAAADRPLYAVTKAGGFGSDLVLAKAMDELKGGGRL